MGAKQGLRNVVDAARLADQMGAAAHFVLVGDGSERRALEALAEDVSRITFVPALDDGAYRVALSAADVLLVNEQPGVAAMAVPSKLTSYFDAGRPIIAATDRSGTAAAEVTAAGAGTVVPAGDPAQLLEAVMMFGADPETASRLGRNGRRYRETQLDQDVALQKWASLIESAVEQDG
ncbi:glycosyltransferase involved in cell wall biosynthesis [Mycolicibacterium iranicum]|uniref:Glycosyltransferase involved in cell wall biosynthesis n=2 Tax=Mycolicibacterium iranicum TaxID=912594 RepID=A0A839Q9Z5_MYCIR|nr:glycosyltransferase involved in cell wall biosynthesis [Mycolicibacterium iranicum]